MALPAQRFYKLGLIGHPVSHSLSPLMHRAALSFCRLDGTYDLIDLAHPLQLNSFRELFNEGGYVGLNVTIPHKQAVMPLMDRLSPEATQVNAVNTIRVERDGTLFGHNTDLFGFMSAITDHAARVLKSQAAMQVPGHITDGVAVNQGAMQVPGNIADGVVVNEGAMQVPGNIADGVDVSAAFAASIAVIVGAGGAARAAMWGMARLGVPLVYLVARRKEQAETLCSEFLAQSDGVLPRTKVYAIATEDLESSNLQWNVLVNTAPIGITDKVIPSWLVTLIAGEKTKLQISQKFVLVYDMVYMKATASLLENECVRYGIPVVSGLSMLVCQAALAFETWTGHAVDSELMRKAIE